MQSIRLTIRRRFRRVAGAFAIGVTLLMPAAALAQAPGGGDKQPEAVQRRDGNTRIINTTDPGLRERATLFASIAMKPLDDTSVVPWLIEHANELEPAFLFELSRRLFMTDRARALEWFAVAQARAYYDAQRCVDRTARGNTLADVRVALDVARSSLERRDEYALAGKRALARPDLFGGTNSPWWICSQGMNATGRALAGDRLREADWLKPPTEWPAIRQEVKTGLAKLFDQIDKPQDDPVPLVTAGVRIEALPDEHKYEDYAWLDADRLVVAVEGPNRSLIPQGRPLPTKRLLWWRPGQSPSAFVPDIVTFLWCAGGGVVSYEGERRIGDDGKPVAERRFHVGPPEGPFREIELRANITAAKLLDPQGSWALPFPPLPSSPVKNVDKRQSPFDCRWETSERLSKPQSGTNWLPLRPKDGVLEFVSRLNERYFNHYIDDTAEPWRLPIEWPWVQAPRVHYSEFKGAYFIPPPPSREQLSPERKARGCLPVHWFWPAERRVEAECVPIDAVNNNLVRYQPSRIGMIRLVYERRTPIGRLPGGVYLNAADGRVLKLVEGTVMDASVSPDGCKIAVRLFAAPRPQMKVVDLCASPAVAGR